MAAEPPKSGPAFNKAAEARQAWREQQKAALDGRAAREFAQIREDVERKKRETARRFARERERMVEQEKARLLLPEPGVALRPMPTQEMRESLAYFKARDMVRRAEHHITEALDRECQEREDAFLTEQERRRAERQKDEQSRPLNLARSFQRRADRGGDDRSR